MFNIKLFRASLPCPERGAEDDPGDDSGHGGEGEGIAAEAPHHRLLRRALQTNTKMSCLVPVGSNNIKHLDISIPSGSFSLMLLQFFLI